ncbi:restriction endonuclease subunit S [Micromonospora sp. CA-259024]|uniref:restriction endonuclease subunit S n=1 Tax=Micromonospora sp. CA-259024 TaxID=3239965 RepID=UPI003D8B101A
MIEAFTQTPDHWGLSRIDRVATVNARIGWKALTASEYQPDGHVFLATPNIKTSQIDFDNVNYISEHRYEESPELKLSVGDVLLAKDGNTLGIVNIVRDLPRPATINGSIAVLRSFDIHPGFLRYVIASSATQGLIDSLKDGMGVPHLFQRDIKKLPVPLPPRKEQRRIADFLDAELIRIDRLRQLRHRMTNLLLLKRERAIEQGLGLTTDSIRSSMVPLKYLVQEVTVGIVVTPAAWYVDHGGVPALRGVNIQPGRIVTDNMVHISNEGHSLYRKSQLRKGDLVVVRTGQAGATVVVPQEFDRANCIDLVIIRLSRDLNPRFTEYFLNSSHARQHIDEHSVGTIQSHFNVGAMKQMRIPRIPLREQSQRVDILDTQIGTIDSLLEKLKQQEDALVERRQALITAAVTGQIDVTITQGVDV